MNPEQILLELYKEQTAHGRHTETQRLEVTKFILVAVAALLGVIGTMKFSIHCIPLSLAIIYLGTFGRRMTEIYVERFDGHMERARAFRIEIDKLVPQARIQAIISANKVVKSERLRDFWIRIHRALIVLGMACLLWNFLAVGARWAKQSGDCRDRLIEQFAGVDPNNAKPVLSK